MLNKARNVLAELYNTISPSLTTAILAVVVCITSFSAQAQSRVEKPLSTIKTVDSESILDHFDISIPGTPVGDLNGDGVTELVKVRGNVADLETPSPSDYTDLSLFFNLNSDGKIGHYGTLKGKYYPAGDIDGDGLDELITCSSESESCTIVNYESAGSGSFVRMPFDSPSQTYSINVPGFSVDQFIVNKDFDSDGIQDLLLISSFDKTNALKILYGSQTPEGHFLSSMEMPANLSQYPSYKVNAGNYFNVDKPSVIVTEINPSTLFAEFHFVEEFPQRTETISPEWKVETVTSLPLGSSRDFFIQNVSSTDPDEPAGEEIVINVIPTEDNPDNEFHSFLVNILQAESDDAPKPQEPIILFDAPTYVVPGLNPDDKDDFLVIPQNGETPFFGMGNESPENGFDYIISLSCQEGEECNIPEEFQSCLDSPTCEIGGGSKSEFAEYAKRILPIFTYQPENQTPSQSSIVALFGYKDRENYFKGFFSALEESAPLNQSATPFSLPIKLDHSTSNNEAEINQTGLLINRPNNDFFLFSNQFEEYWFSGQQLSNSPTPTQVNLLDPVNSGYVFNGLPYSHSLSDNENGGRIYNDTGAAILLYQKNTNSSGKYSSKDSGKLNTVIIDPATFSTLGEYPNFLPTNNIGDINNDGNDDILITAGVNDTLGNQLNEAWLFFGGETISTEPDFILDFSSDTSGFQVSAFTAPEPAGDINGDGVADFAISGFDTNAPFDSSSNGRVYLYLGQDQAPGSVEFSAPDVILSASNQPGEYITAFGFELSGGDYNGDGFSDMAVEARSFYYDAPAAPIQIFFGGADMDSEADIYLNIPNQDLGTQFEGASYSPLKMAFLPAENEKTNQDLLVHSAIFSLSNPNAVIFQFDKEENTKPSIILEGVNQSQGFGTRIPGNFGNIYTKPTVGDLNGDGFYDIILTNQNDNNDGLATSRSYIFSPNSGITISNEGEGISPLDYRLSQNYPNPFNPSTNIEFTLPFSTVVSLNVFDILGREVANLINNEKLQAGSLTIHFDASNLSSGVYLYQLNASGFSQTRKMTLIK